MEILVEINKYSGKFIQVTEEKIIDRIYERVYLPNGVIIFPFDNHGNLLMVIEKRPHENPPSRLKFISGHIEAHEDVIETANRELQEEVGFKAQELELIHHNKATGTVNNDLYFVEAHGLEESKLPNPDGEDSIMAIKAMSLETVKKKVFAGEIPITFPALGFFKLLERAKLI